MTFNVDEFLTGTEHDARDHTGVTGTMNCQIGFGGDMIIPNTFYGPATLTPGPFPGPPGPPGTNPLTQHPIPIAGVITGVAWSIGVAGGSFQLYVDGLPIGLPFVPGAVGGFTPITPAVVIPGSVAELEYVGGPAPTIGSFVFIIEG
jgi:hypothetical protein